MSAIGQPQEPTRIVLLDILRGLGVMMILVSNIQEFSMPRSGYFFPNVYGDFTGFNRIVWHLDNLLFKGKSLMLFSLIFGAGLILQKAPRTLHYRRMAILMTLGLAHAVLLWDGDILVTLALGGMAVFPLKRLSSRGLIWAGTIVIVVGPALVLGANSFLQIWDLPHFASFGSVLIRETGDLERIIACLRGSWISQEAHRLQACREMYGFALPVYLFWFVASAMLLGMGILKAEFANRPDRVRHPALAVTAFMSLGLAGTYFNFHHGILAEAGPSLSFYVSTQYDFWLALSVTLGISVLVTAGLNGYPNNRLFSPVAALGKTALSNYFVQSLICTTLFYGHGFGLYGQCSRTVQFVLVVFIWVLQMAGSVFWLQRFRHGPLEWAWRCAYLGRRIPMSR